MGHLLSCLGKSRHTHTQSSLTYSSRHGQKCSPKKQFCCHIHSHRFLIQSLRPVGKAKSKHPCRMSTSSILRDPDAIISQGSQTIASPEDSQESVTTDDQHLQLDLLTRRCPLLCLSFFEFPLSPLYWPPESD